MKIVIREPFPYQEGYVDGAALHWESIKSNGFEIYNNPLQYSSVLFEEYRKRLFPDDIKLTKEKEYFLVNLTLCHHKNFSCMFYKPEDYLTSDELIELEKILNEIETESEIQIVSESPVLFGR